MNSWAFLLISVIFSNLCSLCFMSEISGGNTSFLNSKKIDPAYSKFDILNEAVLLQFFNYSFEGTLSLSGANRNMQKIFGPFIRSYIINAFEFLFSQSEETIEFLAACGLRREVPYTSVRNIHSQFMPDLDRYKVIRTKIIIPANYRLLAPIIRKRLERTISNEDENSRDVDTKLIIEKAIRSIYIDHLDSITLALSPSFKEFCNFINDIYGIYLKLWPESIVFYQNIAIFYYFIDKRILLTGFYRRLIESQSPELLSDNIFQSIRCKESVIALVLILFNDFLSISTAISFHYFGIYRNFYLWLIAAHCIVYMHGMMKRLFMNLPLSSQMTMAFYYIYYISTLLPMKLVKYNSYLILLSMLLMHFKSYIFGTGMQSLSSDL